MLQEFNHINFGRMRVMVIDGKPWFLAADSYKITNVDSRSIKSAVMECDQTRVDKHTIGIKGKYPPSVILLNERGLCAFVRKFAGDVAASYTRWIHEIAQQSMEGMEPEPVLSDEAELLKRIIASPDFGIALLTEIKRERDRNSDPVKADPDNGINTIVGEFTKWLTENYDKQIS